MSGRFDSEPPSIHINSKEDSLGGSGPPQSKLVIDRLVKKPPEITSITMLIAAGHLTPLPRNMNHMQAAYTVVIIIISKYCTL